MSVFTNTLITEWVKSGSQWRVSQEFEFHSGEYNSGMFIRCDAGMLTDLASIPKAIRWLVPKVGMDAQASVVHDRGYRDGFVRIRVGEAERTVAVSRGVIDSMYLQAMRALKTKKRRRVVIYAGVKAFGWIVWNKYRKNNYGVTTETTK